MEALRNPRKLHGAGPGMQRRWHMHALERKATQGQRNSAPTTRALVATILGQRQSHLVLHLAVCAQREARNLEWFDNGKRSSNVRFERLMEERRRC